MPRTELPLRPLTGINLAINCTFCAHRVKGVEVKDSDLLFSTACAGFKLVPYIYCRDHEHWVHWTVCTHRHYNDIHYCCRSCPTGEGMVEIAHTRNHTIPEEEG